MSPVSQTAIIIIVSDVVKSINYLLVPRLISYHKQGYYRSVHSSGQSKPDMYLMRKFTRYFLTVCGFLWDSTPIPLKTLHIPEHIEENSVKQFT